MEKDKQYLLSFVIPVCNDPDYFQRIVSLSLNQTKSGVEIVVVDGSKKEFLDTDKQHIRLFGEERIKHINKRDGKGFEGATETGIKNATGEFIVLLYNKEQWRTDEEKNGLIDKVITKIKGD